MAYITTNASLATSAPARGYIEALFARFHAWRMYRKTVAELSALTDHELEDIGVTRGSIPYFARMGK